MYTCNNTVVGETYVTGNWTPSESNNWRFVTTAAYAVDSNTDGSAIVYYRFFVTTYGTINSTLQEAYCGSSLGNDVDSWGKGMAGTYLAGSSGATTYAGTECGSGQYDFKMTLTRDGTDLNETDWVGFASLDSGTLRQSSVTLSYPAPKSVNFNKNTDDSSVSNIPATQTKYCGQVLTLSSANPTRTGYTFLGWSTSKTATTADSNYAPGSKYSADSKLTLYAVWKVNTWNVSYNNNGGSGTIDNQTKTYGKSLTLSSGSSFSRTGYTLSSWNTKADGTGTTYALGASYTGNTALTLYAVWTVNKLTVNYYSNHATSAFSDATNTVNKDNNVLVKTQTFSYDTSYSYGLADYSSSSGSAYMTREGYNPTGNWGTTTSGGTLVSESKSFSSGQALAEAFGKSLKSGNASIDIYAQWTLKTYTVSYNKNTTATVSNMPNSQTKKHFTNLTLSSNVPTRQQYEFQGWSTSSTGGIAYHPGGTYSAEQDITLYAIWELSASKVSIYDDSGNVKTGLCYIYDDNGDVHYAIITIYDENGNPRSIV